MPGMKRRALLAAFLLLAPPLAAQPRFQPTPQDRADLARIEAYLNGLRSLKANFVQVAPDGSLSAGNAWLARPGRMRFEYFPPSPILLVAGNGLVVFHDRQLQQTSNIFLSQTPLGILLAERVRLSGDLTVLGLKRAPGALEVTVTRTDSPGEGSLTLYFTDNPLELRQWVVLDAQRNETRVTLSNIQTGGSFDAKLFEFIDPRTMQNDPTRGN
jgi:outer membrane lipoprotein-sorting protein